MVVFKTHVLSPEYKAGQKIQYGAVNRTHINEEGFQYFDTKKLVEFGGDQTGSGCAKKSSSLFLVDDKGNPYENPYNAPVPEGSVEMIGLKKAASDVEKPSIIDTRPLDTEAMEGVAVLIFTAEGSPAYRASEAALNAVAEAFDGKVLTFSVDAYWNARLAAQFGIRQAPSVLVIKDGNVESQVAGQFDEEQLTEIYESAVKLQGKADVLTELPFEAAPEPKAKEEKSEEGSSAGAEASTDAGADASADAGSEEGSSDEGGENEENA